MQTTTKFIHTPTRQFYRRLLKTMMKVFVGDYQMFHRTRLQARKKINQNKQLRDPVQIQEKIFFGQQIRDFLQINVIQGTLQQSGNYRYKARKQHGVGQSLKDGSLK